MGIQALVAKPSTRIPSKGHETFSYLLRNRVIDTVDDVWCADIWCVPPVAPLRVLPGSFWARHFAPVPVAPLPHSNEKSSRLSQGLGVLLRDGPLRQETGL